MSVEAALRRARADTRLRLVHLGIRRPGRQKRERASRFRCFAAQGVVLESKREQIHRNQYKECSNEELANGVGALKDLAIDFH